MTFADDQHVILNVDLIDLFYIKDGKQVTNEERRVKNNCPGDGRIPRKEVYKGDSEVDNDQTIQLQLQLLQLYPSQGDL